MPSLFSRRSRSMSTSRPAPPASSPAHLAAAQAFLASQPSNSNLSASAAATALRTMSPPPTPVNQVQTKRMLNRQTSNSSMASAPRGRSRGIVQRQTSSGSMTERTFRTPSPAQQPLSPPTTISGVGHGVPPVPAVPRTYTEDVPQLPAKYHRRSASMDNFPTRVGSPPLTTRGRTPVTPQNLAINSAANAMGKRTTNPPAAPEMQRSDSQDSRNSINFSYPRGSRPSSPPPRSPLATTAPILPATNGISAAEASKIQHELTQVAATPVKKKKKIMDQSVAEGRHLQTGTVGRPKVTPLEPLPADYQPPAPEPAKKPKKKAALSGQSSHFPSHQQAAVSEGATSDSDTASESPKDRRSLRASGVLMKQPSVVREDWEGEQQENENSPVQRDTAKPVRDPIGTATTSIQPKKAVPEAKTARKIDDPPPAPKFRTGVHSAVTTNPVVAAEKSKPFLKTPVEPAAGRSISISPSRSTRFSDRLSSDLASGRKHEPLGRSISPAKSALKHSSMASDASPTDPRFPGRRGSSVTPSEASDASADGTSLRKKSVRVSFDAPSDSKESFTDAQSSKDSMKKPRAGLGKGKTSILDPTEADEQLQEGMKPRPALPSFGSVRRSERSASPNVRGETSTEPKSGSSSETSSIADPPTMNTSISSDHALGGLMFKESQKAPVSTSNRKDQMPLPPTVTSKESIGYESDTDSVYSEVDKPLHAAQSASQQLGKAIGSEAHAQVYRDEIPMIAVLPATPGIDEVRAGEELGPEVPGGFPTSQQKQANPATPVQDSTNVGGIYSSSTEHHAASSTQQLTTIDEEDSDAASVYSDAAEDLSDLEGDGFGSINAIVESPMVKSPKPRVTSPPESPLAAVDQRRPVDIERTTSWDDTQAHWSGLAQRSRETKQPMAQAAPGPVEAPRRKDTAPPAAKITKAPAPKAPTTPKAQQKQPASSRVPSQPQPSAVIATKQTTPLKNQAPLKSSMRGESEAVAAAAKPRPNSYTGPSSPPRAALQKKHIPPAKVQAPASAPAPAPAPKGLSRRFSNDSDSDSSFRRARRNNKQAGGTYTMKMSMRGGPSEQERPSVPGGRAGVRSLSPPANRRPTSPMGMKTMRSTLRGSQESNVPTLRGQPEGKRSSSLFSRNRTAKSPTRPTGFSSKMRSRLGDSDDEGDSRPEHYKSRFADSSDEDEPKTFRPVRGIPRKKDEGDSTDLDDSSDDQARKSKSKSKPAPGKKLAIAPPPPTQEIASPPQSPTTAKKRGLWSRIRGKKKDDEEEEEEESTSRPGPGQTIAQREGIKDEIEAGKEEKQDAKQLGFNSAAERDALIEQTRLKLEAAKARPQSPVGRPTSPFSKLQRRMTPQRIMSDSWAPPKMPAAAEDRPQTSGAVDGTDRPTIGSRQSTKDRPTMGSRQPTNEVVNGDGAVYGKSGKKKKFGLLRKAFGLTD